MLVSHLFTDTDKDSISILSLSRMNHTPFRKARKLRQISSDLKGLKNLSPFLGVITLVL
jgi:hypothetical protein